MLPTVNAAEGPYSFQTSEQEACRSADANHGMVISNASPTCSAVRHPCAPTGSVTHSDAVHEENNDQRINELNEANARYTAIERQPASVRLRPMRSRSRRTMKSFHHMMGRPNQRNPVGRHARVGEMQQDKGIRRVAERKHQQ